MQNPSSEAPLLSQDGWAEVRARDVVVRYRRSGTGRPMLLLHSLSDSQALWPEVIDALVASYRLIVPTPAEPGSDVESWLAALIDGLGVPNLGIIATEAFGLAPLEACLGRCDQIARIVLVAADANAGMLAAVAPTAAATTPVLVLHRDRPAGEVLPLLLAFLAAGSGAGNP